MMWYCSLDYISTHDRFQFIWLVATVLKELVSIFLESFSSSLFFIEDKCGRPGSITAAFHAGIRPPNQPPSTALAARYSGDRPSQHFKEMLADALDKSLAGSKIDPSFRRPMPGGQCYWAPLQGQLTVILCLHHCALLLWLTTPNLSGFSRARIGWKVWGRPCFSGDLHTFAYWHTTGIIIL